VSWFGKVFGTDAAVSNVIQQGKELLDDAFYTDAERAEEKAAAAAAVRNMVVEWMNNSQGQNLARRLIAVSVTGTWIITYIIATLMAMVAVWTEDYRKALMDSSALLDTRNEAMTGAVMLILAFYFAAPKISEIAEAAMARFGKQPGAK
jgi:hypothetical protein